MGGDGEMESGARQSRRCADTEFPRVAETAFGLGGVVETTEGGFPHFSLRRN